MDYTFYIIIALIFLLLVTATYCIKFALTLIKIQDALENSLDRLDVKYNNLSRILEIPIFYDSQEVRNAVNEIDDARNIILHIASEITSSIQEEAVIEYDNKEK